MCPPTVANLPRAQQTPPTDNSSGGKITIMTANDEGGLRATGHLGLAVESGHNGMLAIYLAAELVPRTKTVNPVASDGAK